MGVNVSIEGVFADRDEAADAVAEVARQIRSGSFSAQAHASDNPVVFVTDGDDD